MSNQAGSEEKPASLDVSDLGSALPSEATGKDGAKLVKLLKNKLHSLATESTKYLESLSPEGKARVAALKELQRNHDELEVKFNEEKTLLEAKYQKLYEPLYLKRTDIVSGAVDVEGTKDEAAEVTSAAKGVPNFWLMALKTHELLAIQITQRDEEALKYLKDIKWSKLDSLNGFQLDFYFNPNPYFKNTLLSKTYHMVDDDEPILERATGTVIEWYPGKNLTQKVLRRKLKEGQIDAKPVIKTKQIESFFNIFNPPEIPEDGIDQDTAEELQDVLENDYDIGTIIKEKIIPHAVSWFTGEALQGEEFDDDEDEDDEDEEDEEDEDDDDEEDEEYEEVKDGEAPQKVLE
ncbi:hypothetical protein O6H91_20G067600 [Diphasiastrum complanatum]|uniref:Uncharacterized protein n=1 Tax=Diphasiastrum complanatum TaxID=34168 RepID=A0ACC2AR80_DIPCM|nr:hypothetical protein O6H91_20G067600 [Diphasiastrum complanatum]